MLPAMGHYRSSAFVPAIRQACQGCCACSSVPVVVFVSLFGSPNLTLHNDDDDDHHHHHHLNLVSFHLSLPLETLGTIFFEQLLARDVPNRQLVTRHSLHYAIVFFSGAKLSNPSAYPLFSLFGAIPTLPNQTKPKRPFVLFAKTTRRRTHRSTILLHEIQTTTHTNFDPLQVEFFHSP